MSAFGGKADSGRTYARCPVMTKSRHRRARQQDTFFSINFTKLTQTTRNKPPTVIVATLSPKLECNVMRKLSAVAFVVITIMITAPLPAIAYTQKDADACAPDVIRLCARRYSRCEPRGLLPCPQQTTAQFRLRCRVQSSTGRECNPRRPRKYSED